MAFQFENPTLNPESSTFIGNSYDYSKASQYTGDSLFYADMPGILGGAADFISGGQLSYNRDLEKMGFENAYNAIEAQKERDWQERLSNTAYQRAAADMKSAGLNPYLSVTGLSGSSTPSGATARSGQGGNTAMNQFGALVTSAFKLAGLIIAGKFDEEIAELKTNAYLQRGMERDDTSLDVARIYKGLRK